MLVTVFKKGRTSKSMGCFSSPCSGVCRETHSSKLWFPTHFMNGRRYQTMCAPEWHWWGLLCTPDGTAEQSHGLWTAGARAEQSYQSKNIHWLCYSPDTIHTLGKTDPLCSKTRTSAFPLYMCTKSHLSLIPKCNSTTEQTGQQEFCLHSQPSCCCPWEQSFLFVSLWVCGKKTPPS